MAKILLAAPLAGIRGSFGASVYSANQAGPYLKLKSARPRPLHPLISHQQSFISGCGTEWVNTGAANRALWIAWAALAPQAQTDSLGQTYYLSGFQWFIKINGWRRLTGRGIKTAPPTTAQPAAPSISTFTLSTLFGAPYSAQITYPAGTFGSGDMFIHAVVASGPGRAVPPRAFKPVYYRSTPGNSSQVFETAWRTAFGDPIIGQRGFIRVFHANSHTYLSPSTAILADVVT